MSEPYTLPAVHGTSEQERALLDPVIYKRFDDLDQSGKICVEYVWIGGTGKLLKHRLQIQCYVLIKSCCLRVAGADLRCKTR